MAGSNVVSTIAGGKGSKPKGQPRFFSKRQPVVDDQPTHTETASSSTKDLGNVIAEALEKSRIAQGQAVKFTKPRKSQADRDPATQ